MVSLVVVVYVPIHHSEAHLLSSPHTLSAHRLGHYHTTPAHAPAGTVAPPCTRARALSCACTEASLLSGGVLLSLSSQRHTRLTVLAGGSVPRQALIRDGKLL